MKNDSDTGAPDKRRIHIICEGQTEEMFVNLILHPHFETLGIEVLPKLIGTGGHRGGNVGYKRIVTDIRLLLHSDPFSKITTFIDFYGIYANFPGVHKAKLFKTAQERFDAVIEGFLKQLETDFRPDQALRVIPYVQMHEFEGLLFSSPKELALGILQPYLWKKFAKILFDFDTPEDINNSFETAPSKRIQQIFRGYQKILHGSIIVKRIGLATIREHCPLFDTWISVLENI